LPSLRGSLQVRGVHLSKLSEFRGPPLLAVFASGPVEEEPIAREYKSAVPRLAAELANEVAPLSCEPIQLVVRPPSLRPELQRPYFGAITKALPSVLDISAQFSRIENARTGEQIDTDEIQRDIRFCPSGTLDHYNSIVVVDDVFATGRTVSLVLAAIVEHGF